MGGALGVLGVGYAGRSQRRMRRVNRSAARLSRGGIGDLRVECVKEVSGRVSFSIWGAGAPWERILYSANGGGDGRPVADKIPQLRDTAD